MKRFAFLTILILSLTSLCFAQETLLLDDFEGVISGGSDGTVDFGAGGGSSVDVVADKKIKKSGEQSLKVNYEAVPGGYMWVARGYDLDVSNAGWMIKPKEINWQDYNAISFYIYGSNSGANIAFDIEDNGNEMWRFMVVDDFQGWKQIVCPFSEFFVRDDWQPQDADNNSNLDFPIQSYQFEPRPEAKGTLYFDQVELVK
ncbi:MAG: hypothetical protein KJ923_00865 [Candidatus Omnitrophica bacterium]|nr:hypothetical protein [Candidatus Omnitrophota bacterium]